MTTAEAFRDHIRDHHDDPAVLGIFREFEDRTRKHEITHAEERNFRVTSRMTFVDDSFLDIDLTSLEDQLAFLPQGRYDAHQAVILHPEGVGARLFDLVEAVQTAIRPEILAPLFTVPTMKSVLWHALKALEEEALDGWEESSQGPRPEPDPSGMNDPRTEDHQAVGAAPELIGHLAAVQEEASLESYSSMMTYDLARDAALELLGRLGAQERERLERITRQALRGEPIGYRKVLGPGSMTGPGAGLEPGQLTPLPGPPGERQT